MILYGNATANHNGMSESPDPSVDCFWKCKHYKNLGDEEKTSIRNQALDDILNNPKVIVTKESPCVVTDENPDGRCTFDNEHCEECHVSITMSELAEMCRCRTPGYNRRR